MLKSYAFDVDYNLVYTDDTIWIDVLENGKWVPKEISQKQYEEVASQLKTWETMRYLNNDMEQSMKNFRGAGKYEKTLFDALSKENNTGKWPSRNKFIEANTYASPIAIITARGHPVEDLRETHRKIILDELSSGQQEDLLTSIQERLWDHKQSDEFYINTYLNNNFYAPCSDEQFLATIEKKLSDRMPDRKNAAFEAFVVHAKKVFEHYYWANFMATRKMRIGFSDDTSSNIEWLHNYIHTDKTGLMRKYPEVLFRMYDTGGDMRVDPIKFSYKNTKE